MENNLDNNSGEVKTYTQEEVNQLLQQEGDRRVTEAMKKAERKFSEQQKLALMNEQEKFQYELDQREKAIAEKEKALAVAELKNEASKILAEKGLSNNFVEFVLADDAQATNGRITNLEKVFKEAVKAEVEKRIGTEPPKKGSAQNNIDIKHMTLDQRQKLYDSDPDTYNQLRSK